MPSGYSATISGLDAWFAKEPLEVGQEERLYFAELIRNVADSVAVTFISIENEAYQKHKL
jgi:hypothetical protein